MTAYYNEIDPKAAAWLRELIARGLVAPGDVDERSISDVRPDDLKGYTQCHFFAGIGVWSYALRRAGWPDDRPVWTGSCPCQPFSAAGKGKGVADERHLWPHWYHLVEQCSPPEIYGEQVASKDGLGWFDLVSADLQASGYACGGLDLCAAGVGAPHIRQRLWFYARKEGLDDTAGSRHIGTLEEPERPARDKARLRMPSVGRGSFGVGDTSGATGERHSGGFSGEEAQEYRQGVFDGREPVRPEHAGAGLCGLADADLAGSQGWGPLRECPDQRTARQDSVAVGLADDPLCGCCGGSRLCNCGPGELGRGEPSDRDSSVGLADAGRDRARGLSGDCQEAQGLPQGQRGTEQRPDVSDRRGPCDDGRGVNGSDGLFSDAAWPGPTHGFWRDADWLFCRDGKWRPVEPGTFPLAHGAPARVVRLRGYGNAINAEAATVFVEATQEAVQECGHFQLSGGVFG